MILGPLADMHPVDQAIRARLADDPYGERDPEASALLAVLDLHNCRSVDDLWSWPTCGHCVSQECPEEWPCETVKTIADALGVTR